MVASLLVEGARRLREAGVEEAPFLEARVLLARVLDVEPSSLLLTPERPVTPEAAEEFGALLARRLAREPLAHIVGQREFYGLSFRVDRRALVPRPETELLVEEALAFAKGTSPQRTLLIADVGTGCGCIAVALAVHLPGARIYALDSSAEALALASENAARHNVRERVTFLQGDLLEPLPGSVDLVVANLPYVPTAAIAGLEPEVRDHEPREALEGGPDGLALVRRLLDQAPRYLRPRGALLLEIGYGQAAEAPAAARRALPDAALDTVPDLAGIPRVVRARLPR